MDKLRVVCTPIKKVMFIKTAREMTTCLVAKNQYRLKVDYPGCFDMLPYGCANHALKVLGPRPFYMGETRGQGVKFNNRCSRIVEEQLLHVCALSVVETAKFRTALMC